MLYGRTFRFKYDISIVIKWGIRCFSSDFDAGYLWLVHIVRTGHLEFLRSCWVHLLQLRHVSDVCGPQLSFRTASFVACHIKWGIFVFSQVLTKKGVRVD